MDFIPGKVDMKLWREAFGVPAKTAKAPKPKMKGLKKKAAPSAGHCISNKSIKT